MRYAQARAFYSQPGAQEKAHAAAAGDPNQEYAKWYAGLHRDHTDDEEAGKRIMERIELDLEQELRGGRSGMSSVSGRLLR